MKKFPTSILFLLAIVLISLIGGVIAIYTTANGPWGYTDPVAYISTARSLANGQGLGYFEAGAAFKLFTIQPPFYPIVLSILGLFKVNLVGGARWLNIFAFVASIFIAGWIFFRFTRTPALGIIASALMCAFPYMVVMFSSAYSEPLFIFLFLSSGWGLLAYLQKEKWFILLISAFLVGLIPVTRYAGIAMILAACLSVFFFTSGEAWLRLKKAILYGIIASLPILIWLVWVYFSTSHSIGGRSLEASWGGLAAQFQAFRGIFMDTVWKWVPFQTHQTLLRYSVRFVLMGVGLVIVFVLSIFAERRLRKDSAEDVDRSGIRIFTFFGLSSLIFVAVLIATYLFTFPTIDIDNRMLLPFYVSSVMCLLGGIAVWQSAWFKGRMRILQVLPWLVAVICVVWYFPQTRNEIEFYHPGEVNGGLTAYHWDQSGVIQAVRALPSIQPVISNDWELLLLWTGRPIYGFWNTFPSEPPLQTTAYGTDPRDSTQSVFCTQGAALVIFNDFPSQSKNQVGESNADQLLKLFDGLTTYGIYPDGMIYLCP
jgi:4-amino-4-deoxy-L-arabinose transferase-like glycosyltransferase